MTDAPERIFVFMSTAFSTAFRSHSTQAEYTRTDLIPEMLAEAEQRGRVAEREACAKVAHAYMISQGFYDCHRQSETIAAAIRARANLTDVAKEGGE
jgi:hypothetical protein